jgi:hypothetical protein
MTPEYNEPAKAVAAVAALASLDDALVIAESATFVDSGGAESIFFILVL